MSAMIVTSINVGEPRRLHLGNREVTTGIYKHPVDGPVLIGKLGIAGDAIMDAKHHGGADQAIYVYGGTDYDWWAREFGEEVAPGTFGENVTIAGLASDGLAVGDGLKIGSEVVLEVTAPRIPCAVLAARMGTGRFVRQFRDAERPGVYCRVITEGEIRPGDPVTMLPFAGDRVMVVELYREHYDPAVDAAVTRRYLAAPLAHRVRLAQLKRLETLSG